MKNKIGITERGDAALNTEWLDWVKSNQPAILISKNPFLLYDHLKNLDKPNVIVHCTITGFGGTILEPNVPEPDLSFKGYKSLIELLGLNRVILRVDPIIPTEKGIKVAINMIEIGKLIANDKNVRVRISFIDNYKHVQERFEKAEIPVFPWGFHAPLDLRIKTWLTLGKPEICGEPEMECTGCISSLDCKTLGVEEIESEFKQRQSCKCLANKFELLSNKKPCSHACTYCYWRTK
jgi:hypothetical protein